MSRLITHRKTDHAAYWGQPNDVWTHDADAPCSHCEVERLRHDRDEWRIVAEGHETRLRAADAEIERLRGLLPDKPYIEMMDEVERLRADLYVAGKTLIKQEKEVERLRDIEMKYDILDRDVKERWTSEIERLRAALVFIEEHPSIAADTARNTLAEEKG
jgi:hypothetical protein